MIWGLAVTVVASGSVGFWLGHRRGYMNACDDMTGEVERICVREPAVAALKPQADAIKAAVDKANNRAADAFGAWRRGEYPWTHVRFEKFEAWLRSGAPAPGAVTP